MYWLILIVFFLAQYADVWTTNRVLKQGGRELNPFLRWSMEQWPVYWWWPKLPISAALVAISYPSPWALAALTVPFIFITIRNYGQVK